MKLYYYPGACSLAANIALREAGLAFDLVKVDIRANPRTVADGSNWEQVNSKGYVPALRLDDGSVLTENVAVLEYVADRKPAARLAPPSGTIERYRLTEWLSFINSELHKSFSPLFAPVAGPDAKTFARNALTRRLQWLDHALGSRQFLTGEQFTVADAYLFVVLSWGQYVDIDLGQWPNLQGFVKRAASRPHVQEALKAEGLLKS